MTSKRPESRTLGDLLDEIATVTPSAEAIVFRGERLDYAGLKTRVDDFALISRNLAELLFWWESGRLKPLVAKVFPLANAVEALTALLSRRYAGKIVLEM